MTIGPRTLDQHMSNAAVASLGNAAAPDRVAGGPFAWHQAEITHQLPGIVEASYVPDLGGEGYCDDQIDTA